MIIEKIKTMPAEKLINHYEMALMMDDNNKPNGKVIFHGREVNIDRRDYGTESVIETIAIRKPEVLEILMRRYNAEQAAVAERNAKIAAIEGLDEIKTAMYEVGEWRNKLNASFEGNEAVGGMGIGAKPDYDIARLRNKYPRADAYLIAQEYAHSENYGKHQAGEKALERVINGDNPKQVIDDMEAEWTAYCMERQWD